MEFRTFIRSLLSKAKISDEHLELFTSETNLELYKVAFTHKSISVSVAQNYETLEFEGDVIVNMCTVKYIREKYPSIMNVSWLTHIKHKIISQSILGLIAEKYGFLEHIRMGKEMVKRFVNIGNTFIYSLPDGEHIKIRETADMTEVLDILHDDTGKTMKKDNELCGSGYLALLEDTFESFIGATCTIIDKVCETKMGASIAVCYAIISEMLNEANVSIKYEDIWDPVSRIKHMAYDRKEWPINKAFKATDLSSSEEIVNEKGEKYIKKISKFKVDLMAWTKGDMSVSYQNMIVIGGGVGRNIQRAKNIACLQGIEYLKTIGFEEFQSNPYKRSNK